MSKLGILAATALSLTLAVASPAGAQQLRGGGHAGGGGVHAGGGAAHMGGGMHMGGAAHMGGGGAFRGANASIGAGRPAAVSGGNFAGRGSAQFAQRGFNHGFRGHDRHFGRGVGFAAGLAAGSALGYGAYDPYYGDDYAYYDDTYDNGYPAVEGSGVVVSSAVDPAYCAQRYRSWDPATGTYLGYDGLRHPCGE